MATGPITDGQFNAIGSWNGVTISIPTTDDGSRSHYQAGGIETWDFLKAKLTKEELRGYLKGNIMKYASRASHKGSEQEDYTKLNWYAARLAEIT